MRLGAVEQEACVQDGWTRVVRAERVLQARPTRGFMGTVAVVVVRHGDVLRVYKDRCPHAGAPLSGGHLAGSALICPRHGWAFDLDTGACPAHPVYALRPLEAREHEGWIEARSAPEEAAEIW